MSTKSRMTRTLGTMVAYGYSTVNLDGDLDLAERMGARVVEILPDWPSHPDPVECRTRVRDRGLIIHSAHGSWGGHCITGKRVDLAQTRLVARLASVDDVKRCIDWIIEAQGRHLVVHPGNLSDPAELSARSEALTTSLAELVRHIGMTDLTLCVENMPPGVHPGSRMSDLFKIVSDLNHPKVALIVDTGHAQLSSSPGVETRAAGALLRSLHVHDNDGRSDTHLPPGSGVIDWDAWIESLDEVGYDGPVMLECIRRIRHDPTTLSRAFLTLLSNLTNDPSVVARRDACFA